MKIFDGNYLFTTPLQDPSAFFAALTVGFVFLFLASAFAYWRRARLVPHNPVLRRYVRNMGSSGMWLAGIGLFLALMRYLQVPYLGIPFLMYLLILGIILTVAYYVYQFSERYPTEVWKLQGTHVERRYRPVARPREPQRVKPRQPVRGKRRR